MMKKQQGFTLIELVAVIVILGALAVVALPRFINLQDEANEAALKGVAGAAGSGMAVNLAATLAGDGDAQNVVDCDEVDSVMQGGLPDNYNVPSNSLGADTGDSTDCTLQQDANNDTFTATTSSTTFTGYYASN